MIMKKKLIRLMPALVMCVVLAAPAMAEVLPPEGATVEPTSTNAPRHAVFSAPYTIDLENNTYAAIVFTMAEKAGTTCFEGVESISFRTTNPNGSHWKVVEYSHSISESEFRLYVTLQDMEWDTPSSSFLASAVYTVFPNMVARRSLSAENESSVPLAPASASIRYVGEAELAPTLVSIRYAGET